LDIGASVVECTTLLDDDGERYLSYHNVISVHRWHGIPRGLLVRMARVASLPWTLAHRWYGIPRCLVLTMARDTSLGEYWCIVGTAYHVAWW
jgi:hypothetical protein